MFSKVVSFACLILVTVCVALLFADTATAVATASPIQIPAWLQAVLGGGALGGTAIWATMKAKLGKFIKLFEAAKLFISETVDICNLVKDEIKKPESVKEWNEFIDAAVGFLKETGNKSLIQKADLIASKKITV
jgi:hypothetical protein